MSFWNTETLRERLPKLISAYNSESVKHCAYELAIGPAALVTCDGSPQDFNLDKSPSFAIPPGQFALLLTDETVTIPANAIAFISIRAGIKFQGLVNVSGFHVDPGYSARLKFSVYNAGSRPIHLSRGDRIFMIWYADLDRQTEDVYRGDATRNNQITSADRNRMEGEVLSPLQLKKEIEDLEKGFERKLETLDKSFERWKTAFWGLTAIALALLTKQGCSSSTPSTPSVANYQNAPTTNEMAALLRPIVSDTNAVTTNQPGQRPAQP